MTILPLGKEALTSQIHQRSLDEAQTKSPSFTAYLQDSFDEVNSLLSIADAKNTEVAVGKSENLHEAMLAFEKADSAFKLLTQVRNRAIEAYQDIVKMQV